jgi:hypothetical protein
MIQLPIIVLLYLYKFTETAVENSKDSFPVQAWAFQYTLTKLAAIIQISFVFMIAYSNLHPVQYSATSVFSVSTNIQPVRSRKREINGRGNPLR